MDARENKPKRANYANILDKPLAEKQRRIAVSLLTAENTEEIIKDSGVVPETVYRSSHNSMVMNPSAHAMMEKRKILDELVIELNNIIEKAAEAPLKYSDKLRAIELKAQLTGVLNESKQGTTNNTVVFDLRGASEEQLVSELAKIEEKKRSIIDATPKDAA